MSFSPEDVSVDNDQFTALTELPWLRWERVERKGDIRFSGTVLGPDVSTRLVLSLIDWNRSLLSPIEIQVNEFREVEKRMERLRALDSIVGLLSDLDQKQSEAFLKAVQRKHLIDEIRP